MKEELDCEYKIECQIISPGEEMDEYRKKCDCITCALCDQYWALYDKAHSEVDKRKGE